MRSNEWWGWEDCFIVSEKKYEWLPVCIPTFNITLFFQRKNKESQKRSFRPRAEGSFKFILHLKERHVSSVVSFFVRRSRKDEMLRDYQRSWFNVRSAEIISSVSKCRRKQEVWCCTDPLVAWQISTCRHEAPSCCRSNCPIRVEQQPAADPNSLEV